MRAIHQPRPILRFPVYTRTIDAVVRLRDVWRCHGGEPRASAVVVRDAGYRARRVIELAVRRSGRRSAVTKFLAIDIVASHDLRIYGTVDAFQERRTTPRKRNVSAWVYARSIRAAYAPSTLQLIRTYRQYFVGIEIRAGRRRGRWHESLQARCGRAAVLFVGRRDGRDHQRDRC